MLKKLKVNKPMLVSLCAGMAYGLMLYEASLSESPVPAYLLSVLGGMVIGSGVTLGLLRLWMRRHGYIVGRPIPVMVANADADDD